MASGLCQLRFELLEELARQDIHQTAVLGRSIVTDPPYSPVFADEDERVPGLPGRRHLPAHHAVLVRHAVVLVRENGRPNSKLRSRLLPIFLPVRRNGEQGYFELPELSVVLQVNYLLQTPVSARAHAEIQQDGLFSTEGRLI